MGRASDLREAAVMRRSSSTTGCSRVCGLEERELIGGLLLLYSLLLAYWNISCYQEDVSRVTGPRRGKAARKLTRIYISQQISV